MHRFDSFSFFQTSSGGDGSGEGGGAAGAGQHHLQQHRQSVLQLQMMSNKIKTRMGVTVPALV